LAVKHRVLHSLIKRGMRYRSAIFQGRKWSFGFSPKPVPLDERLKDRGSGMNSIILKRKI